MYFKIMQNLLRPTTTPGSFLCCLNFSCMNVIDTIDKKKSQTISTSNASIKTKMIFLNRVLWIGEL